MSAKRSGVIVEHLRREQMNEVLATGKRIDGRSATDYREIKIETGVIKKANGSAMVTLGNTQVVAGVKVQMDKPFPDTPNKGLLICTAEVLPLASPYAEPGPPDEDVIELARVVDRGIRESEMIDLEKFVLVPGEKVYAVFADVSILNVGGNLFDATSYAVVAALLTSRLPKFEIKDGKAVDTGETMPPPLKTIPVSITSARIGDTIIVDPTSEEELCMDARVTMTTDDKGRVCAVQKGGRGTFTPEQINTIVATAISKGAEIRSKFKGLMSSG